MNVKQTHIWKTAKRLYRKYFTTVPGKWTPEKRIKKIMELYVEKMGYRFEFYHPILFTEKIQWYKEFYSPAGLINIVDKYLFKAYIESKLGSGYTVKLYGVYENINQLEAAWNDLPEVFVLKQTLQSDGKCIKVIRNKAKIKLEELKKEIRDWFDPKNSLVNSYCAAYREGIPRIIAEEFIDQMDDLYDYKFFCFDGVPKLIYAYANKLKTSDSAKPHEALTFYDMNWEKIDATSDGKPNSDIPKPKLFSEMIEIAAELSRGFPFLRVDFYEVNNKIYLEYIRERNYYYY